MNDKPLSGAYLEGQGTIAVFREADGLAVCDDDQDASVALLALLAFYLGGPLVGVLVLTAIILPRKRRGRRLPGGGRGQVVPHARIRMPWESLEDVVRAEQTYLLRRRDGEPVVLHVRAFHVARLDAWLSSAVGSRFAVATAEELRPLLPRVTASDAADGSGPGFVERLFRPRSHAVVTVCLLLGAVAGMLARWDVAPALPTRLTALSFLVAGVIAGWVEAALRYSSRQQRERLLRHGVRPVGPVPCGVRQAGHVGAVFSPFARGEVSPHARGLAVVARPRSGPEMVFTVGLAFVAGLAGYPYLPMWLCGLAALTALVAIDVPGRRAELEVVDRESVHAIERWSDEVKLVRADGPPVELRPLAARRRDLLALLQHELPEAEVTAPPPTLPPPPPPPGVEQLDESLARLRSLHGR